MSQLTDQQQNIVNYVKSVEGNELVLIDSIAGSGKTTLLQAIAREMNTGNSCYLAYNKAIATSSQKKFPSYVDCRTTHSLAYKATVRPFKLQVGFFGPKHINHKISYSAKQTLVEDIREFCLSKYLTYDEFAEANERPNAAMAIHYLDLMSTGKIDCSHDFYLKLFHILLANDQIDQKPWEVLMLDEAGDLNEVTLEIFKLLPARIKVAVGDPYQNIYTFNHTINCFERLHEDGTTFKLTKSFRVPTHIAEPVEAFCQKYLDPEMEFKGVELKDETITTRGYISRTNGGLIDKIVELNNSGTPYGLVRKAQEIFKVPLMIAGLKYQGRIYDPEYRHIQEDVNDWYENKNHVQVTYTTPQGYIRSLYPDDVILNQAFNLIAKHGKGTIFKAYNEAKKHEGQKQNLMLLTAHSSKGLEFDEVTLAPDMNTSIDELIADLIYNPEMKLMPCDKEALNLYYVACTRALVALRNASHLN